ncbi:MAG: hypothetical protein LBI74_08710 [Synergistaceae bacterium]|nr:hypothetical protein [Synergistaceae bacterium]
MSVIRGILACIVIFVMLASSAVACDCEDPVVIDGLEAYDMSLREGRDDVEGFWGIYLDLPPTPGNARTYRMAIVKNSWDVFPEADYLGVATCDSPGCVRGEVKLLLTRTDQEGKFDAVLLVTENDGARGPAFLVDADDGRERGALDLQEVKYMGNFIARWMLRIIGG